MIENTSKRKCLFCGKDFFYKENNQKYCTPECSKNGMKQNRKKWIERNPDYYKNYMRDRKNANINKTDQ